MAWFKVDDGLPEHRKVRRLGRDKAAAMGVWTLTGAWSASNLTDGFVPAEIVQRYDAREKLAERLVEVGLWSRAEQAGEPGYRFHDWLAHQPSRSDVESSRRDNARRQQQYRGRKRAETAERSDDGTFVSNGSSNALRNGVSHAVSHPAPGPARPGPSRTEGRTQPDTDGRNPRTAHIDELAGSAHSGAAHRLVEGYAATCNRRPPAKILGQLGVEVDALLREQWQPDEVTTALLAWGSKPLGPGALQSVAHEVANRRTEPTRATTDVRVADAQALKSQLRALPGGA